MYRSIALGVILSLFLSSLPVCQGVDNEKDKQRRNQDEILRSQTDAFIVIQHDGNPFREDATIHARLENIDRESPGLRWFKEIGTVNPDDPTQFIMKTERDRILAILFASKEEIIALDSSFSKRMQRHDSNGSYLKNARSQELDRELTKKGIPTSLLHSTLESEVDTKTLQKAFVEYIASEKDAETELARDISEILPPTKLRVLMNRWIKADSLYVPIAVEYFGLSGIQIKAIERDSIELRKLDLKLRMELSSKAEVQKPKPDINEFEWIKEKNSNLALWEARLRPFSHLTPAQFRQAMFCLPISAKGGVTFAGRLAEIEARKGGLESPSEKAERIVLGSLYERGAELEKNGKL